MKRQQAPVKLTYLIGLHAALDASWKCLPGEQTGILHTTSHTLKLQASNV